MLSSSFVLGLSILGYVTSQNKTDYRNVLKEILTDYDKKVMPIEHISDAVAIHISFQFQGINYINEVEEKLVTTGYLEMTWVDSGLKWTQADHNGIEKVYIPQGDVWKPDIVLQNGFKKFQELGGDFYYVTVNSDGEVNWIPHDVFETKCSLDTRFYPFDKQKCDIIFVVWTHAEDDVRISGSDGIEFMHQHTFKDHAVWSVESVKYAVERELRESRIIFTFNLRRKPLYYVINFILPVIMLGLLNCFSFVIPVESGEKIGYSITVVLALAVFLTIMASLLPTNSDTTSILGTYLLLQILFGIVVVITSTLQIRINHHDTSDGVNGFAAKLVKLSRSMRCSSRCCKQKANVVAACEDKDSVDKSCDIPFDHVTWTEVASAIDFFGFWISFTVYFTATLITFGVMLGQFVQ